MVPGQFDQLVAHRRRNLSCYGSFVQQPLCRSHVPVVLVQQQLYQRLIIQPRKVNLHRSERLGKSHPVDPAIGSVPHFDVRIVAQSLVVPVDGVHGAVGTVLQVDSDVLQVFTEKDILTRVNCIKSRTFATVDLVVDLVTVQVVCEQVVAVGVGPVVSQIQHGAHVRVATVDGAGSGFSCAAFPVAVTSRSQQVVAKEGVTGWRGPGNKVGVVAIGLVPIMPALNDVCRGTASPVAATVCHEELAEFVEVQAPLIAAAVGKHFELVTHGMVPPDPRTQFDAFVVGRSGFADS